MCKMMELDAYGYLEWWSTIDDGGYQFCEKCHKDYNKCQFVNKMKRLGVIEEAGGRKRITDDAMKVAEEIEKGNVFYAKILAMRYQDAPD